jgi:triosephosphate isomerase
MISRGVGDGPFTARIHKIDAGSGKAQLAFGSGGSIDLGEFVVSSLLADGSGTLVAGASFDESGPSEVVQRHQ